jgi:iron(III) transport system permease protein
MISEPRSRLFSAAIFETYAIDLKILLIVVVLIIVGLMTVYPLGLLVYGSFRSDAPGKIGEFTLDGYREAFADPTIIKAFWATLWIGSVRTALSMLLAIFFCWVLVRTDTPMKGTLEFCFWINFLLPNFPVTMGWILLLDPTYGVLNQLLKKLPFDVPAFNLYSYAGIILLHIGLSTSTKVLMLAPAFRNMDASLEEASAACGSSNMRTLFRITFPLLLPAVLGAMLLTFIRSLEAFEIEFLLGTPAKIHVYSTKVYDLLRWQPPRFPPAMALSTVFLVSIFICVFIYRKVVAHREYTTVTGKGFRTSPISWENGNI